MIATPRSSASLGSPRIGRFAEGFHEAVADRIVAADNFSEGRFAGAVFAYETMNFTRQDIQIHISQYADAAEGFADPSKSNARS